MSTAATDGVSTDISDHKRALEALQNALQDSTQRNHEVAALLKGARAVLRNQDFPQAARAIFDVCKKIIGANAGYVALLNPEGTENDLLFLDAGDSRCTVDPTLLMPIRGLRSEAYRKCRTVYDNDFPGSRWRKWLPEGHVALENVMFAPMVLDGKTVGLIGVANKPGGFNEDDARMATALGELCAIALRNSKTLDAVRESEQKFRSLLDALPVSIVTLSTEGRITSVNEAWKRFALDNGLEDPRSAGVGVSYLDICRRAAAEGEPSVREVAAGLEAILKGHSRAFSLEYPCPSPDAQRWFLMRAIPMDIACRQVVLIHMDITQRKLAEHVLQSQRDELEKRVRERTEQLARANRELKQEMEIRKLAEERILQSKGTLQTVFDGISEPLIMIDQDGLVKMLNNAALNYFHLNEYTDALGKPCFEAFFGRSAPCEGCARPFSALGDYVGSFERQGVMEPDRLEQVVVYDVKVHTGKQRAAIVRISDITQARIMERQLAQSEKLAALGLLVSSIAHEINNPNNFIVFNLPILRDYLEMLMPLVDDYMEDHPSLELFSMSYEEFRKDIFRLLENMEYGSQRINATVSGLKDFAQKRNKLERHSVDLKQVIEGAMAICHGEIRKRVKSFDVDIPEDILPIHADAKAVEQVLINLLINAAHATDKENSWIRLHILQEGGQGCVIEVSDNGCGMDEKTMEKIFDPFFTTKSSMMGTGLGLYVCRNLVEELGGRIEVESKPGDGSTFRVVLGNSQRQKADR